MAKASQVENFFSFVGGLRTEGNQLSVPENTCVALDNVDMVIDGSVRMRKALEPEARVKLYRQPILDTWSKVPRRAPKWLDTIDGNLVGILTTYTALAVGDPLVAYTDVTVGTVVDGVTLIAVDETALFFCTVDTAGNILDGGAHKSIVLKQDFITATASVAGGLVVLHNKAGNTEGSLYVYNRAGVPIQITPTVRKTRATYTKLIAEDSREFAPCGELGLLAGTNAYTIDLKQHLDNLYNIGWNTHTLVENTGLIAAVSDLTLVTGVLYDIHLRYAVPSSTVMDFLGTTGSTFSLYTIDATGAVTTVATGRFKVFISSIADVSYTYRVELLTSSYTAGMKFFIKVNAPGTYYQLPSLHDSPSYLLDQTSNKIDSTKWNSALPTSKVPAGRVTLPVKLDKATTVSFSNQRLWLGNGNTLLFSVVIPSEYEVAAADGSTTDAVLFEAIAKDVGLFYQKSDPTHPAIYELLPDDGGTIQIQEAGTILHIEPSGSGVLAFSEKGVWAVTGSPGSAFTATSYTIKKVSSDGLVGAAKYANSDRVIATPAGIVYVARGGLMLISTEDGYSYTVANMTEVKINRAYTSILADSLKYSTLFYDAYEKELKLFYADSTKDPATIGRTSYNKLLQFDMRLDAWYTASYNPSTGIISVFAALPISNTQDLDSSLRVLAINPADSYLSVCTHSGRHGLGDFTGAYPYSAYIETEPKIYNDGFRDKQLDYLNVYMQETENSQGVPSSLIMTAKWGWSISANSGKWSNPQQVYKLDKFQATNADGSWVNDNYSVIHTKHKVAGAGRSLSIRFEGEAGKTFHLLGWSEVVSGNTIV